VCKIISSKTDLHQNFSTKFLGPKLFFVKNHFLENRCAPKIFNKIFRSKNIFCEKSFPRKQICTKNFQENFLVEKIFVCIINSSKTDLHQSFSSKFLGPKIFCVQNHFLENRFAPKKFMKIFLSKKIFCRQNHFLENICTKNFH